MVSSAGRHGAGPYEILSLPRFPAVSHHPAPFRTVPHRPSVLSGSDLTGIVLTGIVLTGSGNWMTR